MPALQCSSFRIQSRNSFLSATFFKHVTFLLWTFSEFIFKLGQGVCSPDNILYIFLFCFVLFYFVCFFETEAVSVTQLDWQSSVPLLYSDWPPWSANVENRNCLWRVGVLANRKAGWVEGQGRLYAYTHTHCCGKTQALNMLHKMLTCHYIPPTVFSVWLAWRGK